MVSSLLEDISIVKVQEEISPDKVGKKFSDIYPGISLGGVENNELYLHQLEGINSLESSKNVICIAGTGSGKTEIWLSFSIYRKRRVLAVYPTIALSNDQFNRIRNFYKNVVVVNRNNRSIPPDVRIVLTNPAYLMTVLKSGKGDLRNYLDSVQLIVLDEFSFYNTYQKEMLLELVDLITKEYAKAQIVVLTATLDNSRELEERLTSINGLETVTISGKPFRRPNYTYFVRRPLSIEEIADVVSDLIGRGESTLVFTLSINIAERLKRILNSPYCDTHHFKKDHQARIEVERRFKDGSLKCVISPKTLQQGIDIGSIKNIVHVGLPDDPSDFIQREGRKGRRNEIDFTRSVIIPWSERDLILISDPSLLDKWLSVGNVSYFRIMRNKYLELFRKIYSYYRKGNRGLEGDIRLEIANMKSKISTFWTNMQFYDFGRTKYKYYVDNNLVPLTISKRDLVKYYQPGLIDLTYDSLVVDHDLEKIHGIGIKRGNLPGFLNLMIKKYYSITRGKRDFHQAVIKGEVFSETLIDVKPPEGFGILKMRAKDVLWFVEIESEDFELDRSNVKKISL
ncbi:DEAD/DEAH box helicase [Metallosphaera hakonensis]|uniref:DEAD/DEAH box helicase n=1 Tax=Metallosphaera hakonensis TaxID=79601 RepID=UPI0006D07D40|nr:DEAD/DEAH box helicase [Metallosphaera hakonensis]